jgi:hypothetical protein
VVCLRVDKNVDATALMPQRQPDTTVSARVLDILKRLDDVWNTRCTQQAAEDEGPKTISRQHPHPNTHTHTGEGGLLSVVTTLVRAGGESARAARGTVDWSWRTG